MPEPDPLIEDRLAAALEAGKEALIHAAAEQMHPADLATFIAELDDDEKKDILLAALPEETIADAVEYQSPGEAGETLAGLPERAQREVLDELSDDELVDLLQDVPERTQEKYLSLLSDSKKAVSSDLLKYPEETAGGRMTTAYATVREGMTIREAIESLEEIKESTEILSRMFVVDDHNHILGKVRLRDLTFNRRSTLISEVMDNETIAVDAMADQEEAAQIVAKYDLLVLPVVNEQVQLVGVITHDDAFEILEEESTEDIERLSAISGGHADETYLQIPVLAHFHKRFLWVVMLAFLALLSGWVLLENENVFKPYYILALYLPMVVAAGGNTGAQSATAVIRAMALGELPASAFLRVLWKEMRIGLLMGCLLGLCVAFQVNFLLPPGLISQATIPVVTVATIVGFSLAVQVMSSTLLGAALPLAVRAARLDPAVVASPAITTLVDVSGMAIYFTLAKFLLGL